MRGELIPRDQQQVMLNVPASMQVMSIVDKLLADPNVVLEQAVSLIDEDHNSVRFRERVVIYLEED